MRKPDFYIVLITVDIQLRDVNLEATSSDYYFLKYANTEPKDGYIELVDTLKKLKVNPRMVTVDLLKEYEGSSNREMVASVRMIDNYGSPKIAFYKDGRFDFDKAETVEIAPVAFILKHGEQMNRKAMYEYVNCLIEA